ncbi:MAG TPA: hypothetical protein VIH45_03605 [Desulfuromonadaceae bacterium]
MTEPVTGISGVRETGRKEARSGGGARTRGERHHREEEDDCVDISEEARSRSTNTRRDGNRDPGGTAGD